LLGVDPHREGRRVMSGLKIRWILSVACIVLLGILGGGVGAIATTKAPNLPTKTPADVKNLLQHEENLATTLKKFPGITPSAALTSWKSTYASQLAAEVKAAAAVTDDLKPKATGNVALNVPVSGSGGFNYTQGTYLEGFEFTAKAPISITKLGAYDSNLSRLPNGSERFATVPVSLYDMTSNKLLGTVYVSASDPATGVYRYAALSTPITLNTTHTYSVAWVSLSNYYVASPTLVASDVNPVINYVAMDGNGPGGLTTTNTMVEPNWFYTLSANGLHAINYDLGPNFAFTTSR
jgi:hypothetical protein